MVPENTSYSEEYAQNACAFYLTDELGDNYRLHSNRDRRAADVLPLTIQCPKCRRDLTPIDMALTSRDLLLYECTFCKYAHHNGGNR